MPIDFVHHPHPRVAERTTMSAPKTSEQAGQVLGSANARVGLRITEMVGTMWAAYLFSVIALLSLPAVLSGVFPSLHHIFPGWLTGASLIALVGWISSYFLQLTLLPIIIVGQNIQARAADARAEATYTDADAVLHEALQIQEHLAAQDREIERMGKLLQSLLEHPPR